MKIQYVPILKWKKGEKLALSNLANTVKSNIIPLIELIEMSDYTEIIQDLKTYFPNPIFLDTTIASEDDVEYLKNIITTAEDNDLKIYPVLYTNNIDLYDFSTGCKELCIRMEVPESIEGPNYKETFQSIDKFYSINKDIKINLLLDLGIISNLKEANDQYRDLKRILTEYLINKTFLNSIIICATSFPEDLSKIPAGGKASFKRFDYLIFKKIFEEFKSLSNKFIYSDYGVTKFTDSDIDFRLIGNNILPKLKYTTVDSYLVWKGKKNHITKEFEISYYNLAEDLIYSEFYSGKDFSFGDKDIYDRYQKAKAAKINKCGGSTNWVTINANHHITLVNEQLSKLV